MPLFAVFGKAVYTRLLYGKYIKCQEYTTVEEACEVARTLCKWVLEMQDK